MFQQFLNKFSNKSLILDWPTMSTETKSEKKVVTDTTLL